MLQVTNAVGQLERVEDRLNIVDYDDSADTTDGATDVSAEGQQQRGLQQEQQQHEQQHVDDTQQRVDGCPSRQGVGADKNTRTS